MMDDAEKWKLRAEMHEDGKKELSQLVKTFESALDDRDSLIKCLFRIIDILNKRPNESIY